MSIRNLDPLLDPGSIAVFGASDRPCSVGATVWANVRSGAFAGPVYAVNPKHQMLDGTAVYPDVASLPAAPDLAIVCTPPATVPQLIADLVARGTCAAIVLSAGLTPDQRQAMLDAARPGLLRILGPNCVGMLAPHLGLNASVAHADALPGGLAFVSQSGALVTAMIDWARSRAIGFSHVISLGEQADVDFGDLLDYLASDSGTRAILLYVESLRSSRKFMSAARAAARNKPVIVVKAGRCPAARHAVAVHAGAAASSDAVYDAAIARAGMLRVDTLDDLFLAAETLTRFRTNRSQTLTVLSNGGGAGVMAADAAAAAGIAMSTLDGPTIAALDAVLPPDWSRGNPVDIIGNAPIERYVSALQILSAAPEAGALLFMHSPTALVSSAAIARALAPLARRSPPRVLACWLGGDAVAEAQRIFRDAGIASFATPEEAARAFAMLVAFRRNQAQLMEAPACSGPSDGHPAGGDPAAVRRLVQQALESGRDGLTEPEAKALLAAAGIPVVPTRAVGPHPHAAARAATEIGFPIALKIVSPDIAHKSEVGGVSLHLSSAAEVASAAADMLDRVHATRPEARIEGFSVQAMVPSRHAVELTVGAHVDPVFGPVIAFGRGGTAVDVIADRAVALPPLNATLARALIGRTRVARLLGGYRDTPPADLEAVTDTLVALSQLLADVPEIDEIDINPLLAGPGGVMALDARIRVSASAPSGAANFAIRPYPAAWVEAVDLGGRRVMLRPVRPGDEAQHLAFLERLDPHDLRMRIFYSKRSIEASELARLTQVDYDREIAFIAESDDGAGGHETLGTVRAVIDPDNVEAELGIIVRPELKGTGLGRMLMDKVIRTLREHGTQRLVADILAQNTRMLAMAQELGFVQRAERSAEGVTQWALTLGDTPGATLPSGTGAEPSHRAPRKGA